MIRGDEDCACSARCCIAIQLIVSAEVLGVYPSCKKPAREDKKEEARVHVS